MKTSRNETKRIKLQKKQVFFFFVSSGGLVKIDTTLRIDV